MSETARFGRCELRVDERQLLIDGVAVPLGSRAMELLCVLVHQRHRVLTKSELLDLVWPGLVVEENNLSVQVSTLRKLLGPSAISTVPGIGYRFAQSVTLGALPPARPLPNPDPVHAALAAAQHQEQVTLCARPAGDPAAGPAPWWTERLQPLACRQLAAWGGQLIACPPERLVAGFASARTATACAQHLHQAAQREGQALAVGIHRGEPGSRAAAANGPALQLAQVTPAGQTWLSAEAAAQVIHQIDGDLTAPAPEDAPGLPARPPLFAFSPMPDEPALRSTPTPDDALRPTLAVVPFIGYATSAELFSLGDVVTDQVIAALSHSHAIQVISRLSTAVFRDAQASVQQVSTRLRAHYVVSGRYWQRNGQVRVQVELAHAPGGEVVWAHSIEDSELAALQLDSTLVQSIVLGITRALHAHQLRSFRSQPLPTLASHTLLLAAISLLYRLSLRDFDMAHTALAALRERAPRHAEPLAWLARWHLFRVVQGWSDDPQREGQRAMDCAQQALDLDPDSSLALTMLGNVHTNHLRDLDAADQLYDQALTINPNESLAWLQKGNACSFAGDGQAALAHVGKAVSLSPLDPSRHHYLTIQAGAALAAGDYAQAITAARESLRHNHGHLSTHRVLAIAQALGGQAEDARRSVQTLLRLDPQLTVARFVARSPGARSGLAQTFGQALLGAGLPAGDDDGDAA